MTNKADNSQLPNPPTQPNRQSPSNSASPASTSSTASTSSIPHATNVPNLPTGIVKDLPKRTRDLYLAAALDCEGIRLINVDASDRTRMIFEFEGGEHANTVERQWWEGTLVVCAPAYAASVRKLKSLVHSV
jgi:hypothetical protein